MYTTWYIHNLLLGYNWTFSSSYCTRISFRTYTCACALRMTHLAASARTRTLKHDSLGRLLESPVGRVDGVVLPVLQHKPYARAHLAGQAALLTAAKKALQVTNTHTFPSIAYDTL